MRYLHTMLRVGNLERSIEFYEKVMGMKLVSRKDYPHGEFTLAFLSYGESKKDPCLELTHNWGQDSYELGGAYGHMAYAVEDIYQMCDEIKKRGGKVVREAGPMKGSSTVLAFVEDPDGYKIELIQE